MNKKRIVKLSVVTVIALTVMGCNTKNGSHFNILQLPGKIIDSVFDNNSYHVKKEKIEKYTKIHYNSLREEVKAKSGKHLDEIMNIAEIELSKQDSIRKQLSKEYKTIFHNSQMITEKLVQIISKLYLPKEKTKKINGFTYTELSRMTKVYIDEHFEEIRLAIQDKKSDIFIPLSKKLNIDDKSKQEIFITSLLGKHAELYDDLVVASIMLK